MSFSQAISTCFSKIVTIEGRARRSEYWYFALFVALVSLAASFALEDQSFTSRVLTAILSLCTWTAGVRRLHDTGHSGWWILIQLVPFIGWIILFVFFVQDSQPGDNRYGRNPKESW